MSVKVCPYPAGNGRSKAQNGLATLNMGVTGYTVGREASEEVEANIRKAAEV